MNKQLFFLSFVMGTFSFASLEGSDGTRGKLIESDRKNETVSVVLGADTDSIADEKTELSSGVED